jgi:hypothetical protein
MSLAKIKVMKTYTYSTRAMRSLVYHIFECSRDGLVNPKKLNMKIKTKNSKSPPCGQTVKWIALEITKGPPMTKRRNQSDLLSRN